MISEGYVRAGAKVYIVSRDEKALVKAVGELNALGASGTAHYLVCDLSKLVD